MSGEPEPADLAVQAERAGGAYGVVVEAAGHGDPADGFGEFQGGLLSPGGFLDRVHLLGAGWTAVQLR